MANLSPDAKGVEVVDGQGHRTVEQIDLAVNKTSKRVNKRNLYKPFSPKFARPLMAKSDLNLDPVRLLGRVQRRQTLTAEQSRPLKGLGLIVGRSPGFFIPAKVTDTVAQKARYLHNRGLDDPFRQHPVLNGPQKYDQASRADLDALLLAKLPEVREATQKANKVKNPLQRMRRAGGANRTATRTMVLGHLRPGRGPNSLG